MTNSSKPCEIHAQLSHLSTKPIESESAQPEEIIANAKDNSNKPSGATLTITKPSSKFSKSLQGDINVLLDVKVKAVNRLNIKLSDDEKTPYIKGCCFMPGGEIVLCDKPNFKVKLIDASFVSRGSLTLPLVPGDIAALDANNVIVVLPARTLQFVQVLPSLQKGRTIITEKKCQGIDVASDNIYVSCYTEYNIDAEVQIYDLNGQLKKRIGAGIFKDPQYIAVGKSENKLFVADWETCILSCLTMDGKIVYQYKEEKMRHPEGLYVDDENNVLVCGSHDVQVITAAGKKKQTLLSPKDGITDPYSITFRPNDGTLVVGCYDSTSLLIYKLA